MQWLRLLALNTKKAKLNMRSLSKFGTISSINFPQNTKTGVRRLPHGHEENNQLLLHPPNLSRKIPRATNLSSRIRSTRLFGTNLLSNQASCPYQKILPSGLGKYF